MISTPRTCSQATMALHLCGVGLTQPYCSTSLASTHADPQLAGHDLAKNPQEVRMRQSQNYSCPHSTQLSSYAGGPCGTTQVVCGALPALSPCNVLAYSAYDERWPNTYRQPGMMLHKTGSPRMHGSRSWPRILARTVTLRHESPGL